MSHRNRWMTNSLACALLTILVSLCVSLNASAWPAFAEAQPAGKQAEFRPFVDLLEHADALVTVRFIVKVQMPRMDREVESEITCLAIDGEGLILCSATELGEYFAVMTRLMGGSDASVSATPTDLQVTTADGAEYAADLVARDSDRDLAWVMLRDVAAESELSHVDFAANAKPEIGGPLYVLRRLGPYFGDVPAVSDAYVAAVVDQPRRLIVSSRSDLRLGTPAFAEDGRLLGFVVAQVPGNDDSRAVARLRNRPLPGQWGVQNDMLAGVILPAADIVKATELARQVWAEDQADALE